MYRARRLLGLSSTLHPNFLAELSRFRQPVTFSLSSNTCSGKEEGMRSRHLLVSTRVVGLTEEIPVRSR